MVKKLILLCMIAEMTYAADSLAYKSQIEVNLGTWDVAYTRHLTDNLSVRLKGNWNTENGDGSRSNYYSENDSSSYDRTTNLNSYQIELAGLCHVGTANGIKIELGAGLRVGEEYSHQIDFSVDHFYYSNVLVSNQITAIYNMDDYSYGLAGIARTSYDFTSHLSLLLELNYHAEKHKYQNLRTVTITYSDARPESNYTDYKYTKDDFFHGLESVKVGLAFRF